MKIHWNAENVCRNGCGNLPLIILFCFYNSISKNLFQNNAGFTEFVQAQNPPVHHQVQGPGQFSATPQGPLQSNVHPSLVDSHIRDPKSQGSRDENQNQFNSVSQGSRFESDSNRQQVSLNKNFKVY